eukprot:GHVQ01002169.1.p1 GENE.GHVQ01002169.1~~GHVQ01002169.1.p1  ORF type:complete len:129 (+),score=3.45 GHVQ01002169.1:163-549(+)
MIDEKVVAMSSLRRWICGCLFVMVILYGFQVRAFITPVCAMRNLNFPNDLATYQFRNYTDCTDGTMLFADLFFPFVGLANWQDGRVGTVETILIVIVFIMGAVVFGSCVYGNRPFWIGNAKRFARGAL